jgi:hypothetical protein
MVESGSRAVINYASAGVASAFWHDSHSPFNEAGFDFVACIWTGGGKWPGAVASDCHEILYSRLFYPIKGN